MDLKPSTTLVAGLQPDADRYNGDPTSAYFNMALLGHAGFLLVEGAGGTGTATLTLLAAEDAAGTNAEALPFAYYVTPTDGGDLFGERQSATAAGYLTIAGANKQVLVEFEAAELPETKPWIALALAEAVDDPVDAVVQFIGTELRYHAEIPPTVLT